MEIQTPTPDKLVTQYDITLVSGLGVPVIIDESLGDTYTKSDTEINIYLSPKPSLSNPKEPIPAERMTLYLKHVVSIQERQIIIKNRTPEQEFAYQQTLQELTSKTIH